MEKNQNNHYVPGKKIFLYVVNIVIFALLILLFISFWASGNPYRLYSLRSA